MNEADIDGDGKISPAEALAAALRELGKWNPIYLACFISLSVIPPLLGLQIIKPCFECYDFEAAALHEIGHFLGFGHPDNIPNNWIAPVSMGGTGGEEWAAYGPAPGNNSYHAGIAFALSQGRRPERHVCEQPWDDVIAGVPPNATGLETGANGYLVRGAQMQAQTQHNPQPCLTEDDLEGLQVLYPDCSLSSLSSPVCHTVQINLGNVRVGVYLLIPFGLALITVIAFSGYTQSQQRKDSDRRILLQKRKFDENKQRLIERGSVEQERLRQELDATKKKAKVLAKIAHKSRHGPGPGTRSRSASLDGSPTTPSSPSRVIGRTRRRLSLDGSLARRFSTKQLSIDDSSTPTGSSRQGSRRQISIRQLGTGSSRHGLSRQWGHILRPRRRTSKEDSAAYREEASPPSRSRANSAPSDTASPLVIDTPPRHPRWRPDADANSPGANSPGGGANSPGANSPPSDAPPSDAGPSRGMRAKGKVSWPASDLVVQLEEDESSTRV